MNTKHQINRDLYIQGKSITDIALLQNTTRQTIYAQKRKDLEQGIDWDELRLAKSRDISGVKMSEQAFVASLIKSYEDSLESLKELPPTQQLELTTQYAKSYYRLKAPLKTDCKAQVHEAISTTIYKISELALEIDDKHTIEFLSKNSDAIVMRCFGKKE